MNKEIFNGLAAIEEPFVENAKKQGYSDKDIVDYVRVKVTLAKYHEYLQNTYKKSGLDPISYKMALKGLGQIQYRLCADLLFASTSKDYNAKREPVKEGDTIYLYNYLTDDITEQVADKRFLEKKNCFSYFVNKQDLLEVINVTRIYEHFSYGE